MVAAHAPSVREGVSKDRLCAPVKAALRALATATVGLIAACGDAQGPVLVVPVTAVASAPAAVPAQGRSYDKELASADKAIAQARQQMAQQPDNLVLVQQTVSLLLERARLGGKLEDYGQAQDLLDGAASQNGPAAALCPARARLHFLLHRLRPAGAALAECAGLMEPLEAGALAADIAFYSGDYRQAETLYRDLVNQGGNTGQYIRLALFRAKMGAPGEAAALLEAAEKRYHGGSPSTIAWLRLQRGEIAWQRGRLDEALALYQLASDAMPGWWLLDEHVAEIRRLQDDTVGAQAILQRLIARDARPEHMDELARLLIDGPTPEAARPWIARAQDIHRSRLQAFPEAAAGHAVDHFLQFGSPAEALTLARRNATARPFGEARITLAAALLRAGKAGEAAATIRSVQDSGWSTAQLHAVSAQIHAAIGQTAMADARRAQAIAMNPHAMRLYQLTPPMQP